MANNGVTKLSKCANGGKVSWDYANKRVKMEGTTSDKCFIYFDKMVTVDSYCDSGDNLADCIKTYGNAGYDKSSIYIHDSSLANGAGDGSYRFAGASEHVNNFVCFGSDADTCPTDNLYRIIGVFGDQVKLIKYDYATSALLGTDGAYKNTYAGSDYTGTSLGNNSKTNIGGYYWNTTGTNTWSTSTLNTVNLNVNFLSNLGVSWANMISTTTWKVGGNTYNNISKAVPSIIYQKEIVSPATSTTYSAKIGLMYVSDYGYAANSTYWTYPGYSSNGASSDYRAAINANWMYMGLNEWTIMRRSDNNFDVYNLYDTGRSSCNVSNNYGFGIRPSFYLKSSIKYGSGKGTKDNPIRLGDFEITLANVVKEQYTGIQGTNGIFLHNGTIKSGDTVIDANDGSYRYAGANPNNYVCFGSDASTCSTDNLYRIIGVFGDQVKLIKYDYANSNLLGTDGSYSSKTYSHSDNQTYKGNFETINRYTMNSAGVYLSSSLNSLNLNVNFINSFSDNWKNMIYKNEWNINGVKSYSNNTNSIQHGPMKNLYQNEIVSPGDSTAYSAKIGLMYVSDYGYAANPTYWTYSGYDYNETVNENWFYMGLSEWTISHVNGGGARNYGISYTGSMFVSSFNLDYYYAIRPCFYLNSNVKYVSGNGTSSSPYRLS